MQKKNIAILTFQDTTNFGAALQAFALCRYILNRGYDCELLDYQNPSLIKRELPRPLSEEYPSPRSLKQVIGYYLSHPKKVRKHNHIMRFIKENCALSKSFTPENIKTANNEYSSFIVGSDMVWNMSITDNDFHYMLDFVTGKNRKFSFASSIGAIWDKEYDETVCALLSDFALIGVREHTAKVLLEDRFGLLSTHVCDPTMLLTATEWRQYTHIPRKRKYVLVYFTDDEHMCLNAAVHYGREHNMDVYFVSVNPMPHWGWKAVFPESIESFLGWIDGASAIFTASYHGFLFACYFEKEFFFVNRAEKSRLVSIASYLEVHHRELRCEDDWKVAPPIDYSVVHERIIDFRTLSQKFLNTILEK